jgi:hypothetical protein
MLAPGLELLGRDPIEDAQCLTAVNAETLPPQLFTLRSQGQNALVIRS